MARRVRWTEPAATDLDQLVDYLGNRSPKYTRELVRRIWAAIESLEAYPERGRWVPELTPTHLREVIVDNYRLVYEALDDELRIHGVIHGARALDDLWSEEDRPLPPWDQGSSWNT